MPEICCSSLDEAWLRAIEAACGSPRHEVSPLIVAFDAARQETPPEFAELRDSLNRSLEASDRATVETVANTLFPYSLWNPSRNREHLFQRYLKILPALRRFNKRGLYFERLISYPDSRETVRKNQLDHIVETFTSGIHRRSGLQAAVFYPPKDLVGTPQLGFPCLHQVAFAHNQARGTLTVTGFYPMQFLFERAYGNYLGLSRLGEFMAKEMKLRLERVVCFAGIAHLDVPARQVKGLLSRFLSSRSRMAGA